jgi:hypothetical protein
MKSLFRTCLFLALLGLTACAPAPVTPTVFPTSLPAAAAPTAQPLISSAFDIKMPPSEIVFLAYNNLNKTKTHREKGSLSTSNQVFTVQADIIGIDQLYEVMTPPKGTPSEYLRTGGKTYKKSEKGWEVLAESENPNAVDLTDNLLKSIKNAQIEGTETFNGHPTVIISYELNLTGEPGLGKIWVGLEDGLPYRNITSLKVGKNASTPQYLNDITFYDFNVEITIPTP